MSYGSSGRWNPCLNVLAVPGFAFVALLAVAPCGAMAQGPVLGVPGDLSPTSLGAFEGRTDSQGWSYVPAVRDGRTVGVLSFRTDERQRAARGIFWFDGAPEDWSPYVLAGSDLAAAVEAAEFQFGLDGSLRRRRALDIGSGAGVLGHVMPNEFVPATSGYVAQLVLDPLDPDALPGIMLGDHEQALVIPRRLLPCTPSPRPGPGGTPGNRPPRPGPLPLQIGELVSYEDASQTAPPGGSDTTCGVWSAWSTPMWVLVATASGGQSYYNCIYDLVQTRERSCTQVVDCRQVSMRQTQRRVLDQVICLSTVPCAPHPPCVTP